MPPTESPRLPQELLDTIVDNVDDALTLTNCIEASNRFIRAARRGLHWSEELHFDLHMSLSDGVDAFIATRTAPRHYTREVRLIGDPRAPLWICLCDISTTLDSFREAIALWCIWVQWRDCPCYESDASFPFVAQLRRVTLMCVPYSPRYHGFASKLSKLHTVEWGNMADPTRDPDLEIRPRGSSTCVDLQLGQIAPMVIQSIVGYITAEKHALRRLHLHIAPYPAREADITFLNSFSSLTLSILSLHL